MSAAACIEWSDLTEVLMRAGLLSTQTPDGIHLLAARAVRQKFCKGELLFSEGEPGTGLHMISRGRVRLFKTSVGGREQILAMKEPGEAVAELPVMDGGAYAVSAMAVEDTEVAFISRSDFQGICMEHPEVGLKMLAMVGARLRQMMGIIEELSFSTVRERLASVLLRLAEREGRQTARGVSFMLPAGHQELASQLGTVRELVSRNLLRLQADGLVTVNAREIVVRDMNGLAKLIGETRPLGQIAKLEARSNVIRRSPQMPKRGKTVPSQLVVQSNHRYRVSHAM
jgi:CRP/FNR family transcriptional regulator